jgi:restriction system protein
MRKKEVPTFDELMDPAVQALKRLGGSASIDELVPEIVRLLGLPQEVADLPHGTTGRTELEYRSAWARTYLRKEGLIENSERGIWRLHWKAQKLTLLTDGKLHATSPNSFSPNEPQTTSQLVAR